MTQGILYSKSNKGIKISVIPAFLEDQSSPKNNVFSWAYNVRIENLKHELVQLIGRHWRVIDANGLVQDVRDEGGVVEQKTIGLNEVFSYTSAISLKTASGMMIGVYKIKNINTNEIFIVEIPPFSLDSHYEKHIPA